MIRGKEKDCSNKSGHGYGSCDRDHERKRLAADREHLVVDESVQQVKHEQLELLKIYSSPDAEYACFQFGFRLRLENCGRFRQVSPS